ncbi:hypothetical protein PFISCL1PPCAC_12117, partial [Pristionchus fissidentatus]
FFPFLHFIREEAAQSARDGLVWITQMCLSNIPFTLYPFPPPNRNILDPLTATLHALSTRHSSGKRMFTSGSVHGQLSSLLQ